MEAATDVCESNNRQLINSKEEGVMAKNGPKGHGRVGRIRGRSQTFNPKTKRYVERDTKTGRFINVKSNRAPFKDVRVEK